MAAKIFADPALLEQVNAIIHPAVKKYLADRLAEAKYQGRCGTVFRGSGPFDRERVSMKIVDEMWYIYAREDVRRRTTVRKVADTHRRRSRGS